MRSRIVCERQFERRRSRSLSGRVALIKRRPFNWRGGGARELGRLSNRTGDLGPEGRAARDAFEARPKTIIISGRRRPFKRTNERTNEWAKATKPRPPIDVARVLDARVLACTRTRARARASDNSSRQLGFV